jgi:hypothetical protein
MASCVRVALRWICFWEFARTWSEKRINILVISIAGPLLSGLLLGGLYFSLAPLPTGSTSREVVPAQESRLGMSLYAVIKFIDAPAIRRKYVFQIADPEKAGASLYVSASDRFIFTVQDVWGENYPLEIRLGEDGIPLGKLIYLSCEVGIGKGETKIAVFVNAVETANRILPFEIDLGSRGWKFVSFGSDEKGNLPGAFSTTELQLLTSSFRAELELGRSWRG